MYTPLGLRQPVFLDNNNTIWNPSWAGETGQPFAVKQVQHGLWLVLLLSHN
jgi:hypothetical protein